MKHSKMSKVMALVLCVMMLLSVVPMTAFASIANWDTENVVFEGTSFGTNGYYNVISKKDYTLVPGAATETEMVLNNATGNRRQVIHVIEVDPSNPDVSIIPGYYNIDKDVSDRNNQFPKPLTEMAAYYESELGYRVVGGMNTDLTYAGDAPRVLVYNGEILGEGLGGNGSPSCCLCVYKDADGNISCMVKPFNRATLEAEVAGGTLLHAVGVSFGMVVNDGQLVSKTEERTSASASRSMVGVKEDGTLVICMNDGRSANNSIGFCNYEEGECMLALGCKWAANCDGGGSSTFISRRWGEEALTMRSVPSDGSERPTLHGVFVVSNTQSDGKFNSVSIEPNEANVTPNSVYTINAVGTDSSGMKVAIPAEATWQLSDDSFGTIENGVFTSTGKMGTVDARLIYNGEIVGSMTINVVDIDTLVVGKTAAGEKIPLGETNHTLYVAPGTTTPFYLYAAIGDKQVETKLEDFTITVVDANGNAAGSLNGFSYTAPAGRTDDLTMKVVYNNNPNLFATCTIRLKDTIKINDTLEEGNGIVVGSFKSTSLGENIPASFEIVTAETGKVKNGEKAIAFTIDTTNGCGYGYFGLTAQPVNRDGQFTGAKKIGMWIYIPDNIPSLWVRISDSTGDMILELIDTGELYREKYDTGAWHYFAANAEEYPNFIPGLIWFYVSDRDGADAGYYMKDNCNPYTKFTLYFDDLFTMDRTYSSYDYYEPIFGDIVVGASSGKVGTKLVRNEAQTVSSNVVSVYAEVEEDTVSALYNASGLDYASAKAYLDGNAIDCTAFEGKIYADNIHVSAGVHTIRFAISDKAGNEAVIERNFKVAGTPTLTLVPEVDDRALIGSVQWFKLVAVDLADIKSATMSFDLDGMNEWYADYIEVAEGFSVASSVDETTNTLTLTFTKTGTPADTDVLARIPVHVWESKLSTFAGFESYTPQNLYSRGWVWPISIVLKNGESSRIVLTDGTVDSFSFDKMTFATELYGAYRELEKDGYVDGVRTCWHLHDFSTEEVVENTPYLTKTRKYCAECDSWIYFTVEKSTDDPNNTGWKLVDGKWHYYVDGSEYTTYYGRNTSLEGYMKLPDRNGSGEELLYRCSIKSGVITGIKEEPYTGAVPIADYTTEIYENGKLVKNKWVRVEDGDNQYYYYAGPDGRDVAGPATDSVAEVDGKLYSWLGNKTNNTNGRCTGLYSGNGDTYAYTTANQKKYSSNTFYLAGVVLEGWYTVSGKVYDNNKKLVTGFRNADGTPFVPTKSMMNDPDAFYGVYYFDDSGYLLLGANSIQYFFEAGNASESRLYYTVNYKTYTEDWKNYGNGIINGFKLNGEGEGYLAPTVGSNKNLYYENGLPANGFRATNNTSASAVNYIHYAENGSVFKSKVIKATDGYYYKTQGDGRLLPTAGGTKAFDPRNATVPGEPLRDCRYTGAITGGYALYGVGYNGLKLVDGVLKNADDSLFNAVVPNAFDQIAAYKDGMLVNEDYAEIDGVLYKVENSVAVPFNGIYEGQFYLNGLEGDAEVFAEKYMLVNGKVYNVNADGSAGTAFSGIIEGVYYADGLATDYEVIGGTKVKADGVVYTVKFNGALGARFTGMIGEARYVSGVLVSGWDGECYYADGVKYVSTVAEIDGVYYGFDANGKGAKQNGLFEMNGKNYYAIAGNLMSGWQQIEDDWYYFDETTFTTVETLNNGYVTFEFEADGKLVSGKWYTTEAGSRYYYGPKYYKGSAAVDLKAVIDGNTYYFDQNGYRFEGKRFVRLTQQTYYQWYDFGSDGIMRDKWDYTGLVNWNGRTYYLVNGVNGYGMYLVDGAYYYCASANNNACVANITRFCSINHDLLPSGDYSFGADGKMLDNDIYTLDGILSYFVKGKVTNEAGKVTLVGKEYDITAEGKVMYSGFLTDASGTEKYFVDGVETHYVKNGLVKEANGDIRYYENDVAQYAGVVTDGNGNYYYINSSLKAVKSTAYTIGAARTNGLVEAGTYQFDTNGVMQNPKVIGVEPPTPAEPKNGLVKEDNGDIRYYENDVAQYAGVVTDGNGNYYYINSSLKAVKSTAYTIGAARTNGLVEAGTYQFDANGVMQNPKVIGVEPPTPAEPKNGLVKEDNGDIRYYENDVAQYAGVVKDDEGNYYYINSSRKAVKNCTYGVGTAKANGLVKAGTYQFDENGVMQNPQVISDEPIVPTVKNGLVKEDNGDIRYYENDVAQYAGVVKDDEGNYYYINSSRKAVKNCTYGVGTAKANGLVESGIYQFDVNGVMQDPKIIVE